jgi:hypothetical protein
MKLYLKKTQRFYNYLDYQHLVKWYKLQEIYFDKNFSKPSHKVFFYDNLDIDYDKVTNRLKKLFAYRAYKANSLLIQRNKVKHKEQNDINQIFVEDYG